MPVHRIRLHGPWDVNPHARAAGRMTIPGTLREGGWPGCRGVVSFYRRFGRPSNLSAGETVWLVLERVVGASRLVLNDVPLGDLTDMGQFEITSRLTERNMLELHLNAADDGCGIVGDVVLEIRSDPVGD